MNGAELTQPSCASGFADELDESTMCSCDMPACGTVSGACATDEGTALAAGGSLTLPWSGVGSSVSLTPAGACTTTRALPAGRYRVSIDVFASAADALAHGPARILSRDFELPATNGLVDVPLGPSADDGCDPTPDAPVAACTGKEALDVPCALAAALTFDSEGGLAVSHDSEALSPPATLTRTRTSGDANVAPLTCATRVPRCTRDARVITTGSIVRALAAPGVATAFAADLPVYGEDPRASDGTIFVVRRPDGTSLGIGSSCATCARPTTTDLLTLQSVLSFAESQQLADPACAALAP